MDPAVFYASLAFAAVAAVTIVAAFVLFKVWPAVSAARLRSPAPESRSSSILRWEERLTGWRRTLARLGSAAAPKDPAKVSRLRRSLIQAGYQSPQAVSIFLGVKLASAIAFGYLYTLYGVLVQRVLTDVLGISIVLAVIGFFVPNLWLRTRIQARHRAIVNALPDVLDLLVVCVEAGLGFDAAVARVAEHGQRKRSPLHEELMRMHLEIRAGRPRAEALRALAERTGVQEVKTIVGTFVQADRLGTPLGKTLRVHSETARVQRRHRAERQAQLAPLKMLFPTVMFLFPCFFLVTLGPSALRLMKLMGSIFNK